MDFSDISTADLDAVKDSLGSKLRPPYSELSLKRIVSANKAGQFVERLSELDRLGFSPSQISVILNSIVEERAKRPVVSEIVDLVTTGPEVSGVASRDTAVVVRNLFSRAKKKVLVAGYAVYQGKRVFEALAHQMKENESLEVQMYLNLPNENRISEESLLVRRFIERFRNTQWPANCRMPSIFYDPRSVATDPKQRASLHAKCIVIDDKEVFISSANFTDRAQHQNIEVGVRISSAQIANQLTAHFESLAAKGILKSALL